MYLVRYYMRMSELSPQEEQKKPAPLGPVIAPHHYCRTLSSRRHLFFGHERNPNTRATSKHSVQFLKIITLLRGVLLPATIRKMTESKHLDTIASTFEVRRVPESEVELVGEIPFADIEPHQEHALKHFQKELELPGFRKGHVPLDMVRKRVGEIAVLEEAVEHFMRDFYPALLTTHNIDAIGRPDLRITKLAPGNPVGITIHTAVYPEVILPESWKTHAETVPLDDAPAVVEDHEVDNALESVRRAHTKAQTKATEESTSSAAGDASSGRANAADQEGSAVESNATPSDTSVTDIPAEDTLPPLDDAFAQSLGPFADLADLKLKMRENLIQEKTKNIKDKRRGKIIDSLLEKVQLSVPAVFVDSELEKIVAQMNDDVTRYGMTFEEYLKRINKTQEQLREELREQARKRAKLQLVLNKIAADEKIEADKPAVDEEMKHALDHFPEARPDLLRIHIETVLRNEKVLQILEGAQPLD